MRMLLVAGCLALAGCSGPPSYRAIRPDTQPIGVVRTICTGEANAKVGSPRDPRTNVEQYRAVGQGCMARHGYVRG